MKNVRFNLLTLFMLSLSIVHSQDINYWDRMVEKPTYVDYYYCVQEITKYLEMGMGGEYDELGEMLFAQRRLLRLLEKASKGDELSCLLTVELFPYFESHPDVLEEIDIAIGKSIKYNPRIFLFIIQHYALSTDKRNIFSISSLVGALDDTYVDKPESMLKEIEQRRVHIESVNNNGLMEAKNICLEKLDRSIIHYNRIIKGIK